jgi:hypothetical protein
MKEEDRHALRRNITQARVSPLDISRPAKFAENHFHERRAICLRERGVNDRNPVNFPALVCASVDFVVSLDRLVVKDV